MQKRADYTRQLISLIMTEWTEGVILKIQVSYNNQKAGKIMLDYLWGFMLILGVVWGLFNGRADALTEGVLTGAKEAVTMSITMLGIMSAWTGIMQIAQKTGIIESISSKLRPFMKFMFPNIDKEIPAYGHICTNIVANVLGLGWAATPAGLKAMEELSKIKEEQVEKESGENSEVIDSIEPEMINRKRKKERTKFAGVSNMATDEMCTFLVLNISSLQLIPVNIIAYRSQYGSVSPAAIVVPAIIATTFSTLVAIVFCKIMTRAKTGR